jgi:hypothetical protein
VKPYVEALFFSNGNGVAQRIILYSLNLFFLALLAVCAANVATLVFARTATREGEITVRSALAAAVVGGVPALKATGPRLQARLKSATSGGSGMSFGGLWTGVIVTQVALTVVFLLSVVSFGWNVSTGRFGATETAFPAEQYLSVRLEMDREIASGAPAAEEDSEFDARFAAAYRELERRLAAEDAVLYLPTMSGAVHPVHLAVHVKEDPQSLAPRLRGIAAEVSPTLRLYDLMPLDEIGRSGQLTLAFFARVLAVVGGIALILSTAGVYSLMAFTVARRTREIGIRSALGAAPRGVVRAIFSRAFAQIGLGILAGSLPGSLLVARGAPEVAQGGGLAVGITAFFAVAVFMIGVGLLAAWIPAVRALRIQPTEALRTDA